MKVSRHINQTLAACVVAATGIMFSATASASAVSLPGCTLPEKQPSQIPSQRVGNKVIAAFEFYEQNQVDEAIGVLKDASPKGDFDTAYVYRYLGNLIASKGKNSGKEAIGYLKTAVEKRVLNPSEQQGTVRLLADLYLQEEMYAEAIPVYEEWMQTSCKHEARVYVNIAHAKYQLQKLPEMIAPLDKAISLQEEQAKAGKKISKDPYTLKMTSYYERKMYKEAIGVLETALQKFPDYRGYWVQLGMFYMMTEQTKKALSLFQVAYGLGHLEKASEIKALANLYAVNEMPYNAAKLLEKHINDGLLEKDARNYSSMANNFHASKEHVSAAKYYAEAFKYSDDIAHLTKQATLLLTAEKYTDAIKAYQQAISVAKSKKGRLHMGLMESYIYTNKFKEAYQQVILAMNDPQTRRTARAWKGYIEMRAKNNNVTL